MRLLCLRARQSDRRARHEGPSQKCWSRNLGSFSGIVRPPPPSSNTDAPRLQGPLSAWLLDVYFLGRLKARHTLFVSLKGTALLSPTGTMAIAIATNASSSVMYAPDAQVPHGSPKPRHDASHLAARGPEPSCPPTPAASGPSGVVGGGQHWHFLLAAHLPVRGDQTAF